MYGNFVGFVAKLNGIYLNVNGNGVKDCVCVCVRTEAGTIVNASIKSANDSENNMLCVVLNFK